MSLKLDTGETIRFGLDLPEAEAIFSRKATENASPLSRTEIDKRIEVDTVALDFDSGKLKTIEFKRGYQFHKPLTPYSEDWKNLPPINSTLIHSNISREEVLSYISKWKGRAASFGVREVDGGDLSKQSFSMEIMKDKFIDMIHINLGPSRRVPKGGLWADSWSFLFTVGLGFYNRDVQPGQLDSLSAFCDEFNTVGRKIER